jgi:uncharacterized protein YbcI
MRSAFQDTMRERFSEAVEQLVGRKVVGFLSQVHLDPDLAVETFILEPDGDERTAVGEARFAPDETVTEAEPRPE